MTVLPGWEARKGQATEVGVECFLQVIAQKGDSRLGVEVNSRLGVALCCGDRGYSPNYYNSLSNKRKLRSQRSCACNE